MNLIMQASTSKEKITASEATDNTQRERNYEIMDEMPPTDPCIISPTSESPSSKAVEKNVTENAAEELTINMMIDDILGEDYDHQVIACEKLQDIVVKTVSDIEAGTSVKLLDRIIDSGIVARCTEFLKNNELPILQLEAAKILANIATGPTRHTLVVVETGAVDGFIGFLSSSNPTLVKKSVLALGNIAVESLELRKLLISKGIIPLMVELAESENEEICMTTLAWTISNICQVPHKVLPTKALYQCLPTLIGLIQKESENLELLEYAFWGLHYLTQSSDEDSIAQITSSGIVPLIVRTLSHRDDKVIGPCLLLLGNIVSSNIHAHTDVVLNAGILPQIQTLILQPNLGKEVAWLLSNIAAGTEDQREALIVSEVIPLVIQVLGSDHLPTQKEAAYIIFNILDGGSMNQIRSLISSGVIPPLVRILDSESSQIVRVVLDSLSLGLQNFALIGEHGSIIREIEESGGFVKLSKLQSHVSDRIVEETGLILDIILSNTEEPDE